MDSALGPSDVGPFSLLETMRLENGEVRRLERHLTRMASAANRFGYRWEESAVRRAIAATATAHANGSWRVRLLLAPDGAPTIECTPYVTEPRGPWQLAFATAPIDDRDPFVLNKTTHRDVYDAARRSRPNVDDVLLWNRRGEVTESTIANLVAEIDSVRCTPPVTSGLLAGTFRAELLDAGTIRERVLTKADVAAASRLWLINSVREWIDAKMIE